MHDRPSHAGMLRSVLPLALALAATLPAHGQTNQVRVKVAPENFELAGMQDGRQVLVDCGGGRRPAPRPDARTPAMWRSPPASSMFRPQGYVRPAGKGEATITVEAAGRSHSIRVIVRDFDETRPLHFANDIVPLLTRHGCNAGGCHGKASGQNGFKLSLFGFDPAFDYNAIVKEARGRRVFPAAPDSSLLLTKADRPGAARRRPALHRRQRGLPDPAPLDRPGDAGRRRRRRRRCRRSRSCPDAARPRTGSAEQQLAVLAHYSDGSVRDVTRQAQYQSNEIGRRRRRRGRPGPHASTWPARRRSWPATRARSPSSAPPCRSASRSRSTPTSPPPTTSTSWPWPSGRSSAWCRRTSAPTASSSAASTLDLCGRLPTPDEVARLPRRHASPTSGPG